MTIIASDFHNNGDGLEYILTKYKNEQIVLLGDFFDGRGYHNNPKRMLNVLTNLTNNKYDLKHKPIIIRGNHDEWIINILKNYDVDFNFNMWIGNGGLETLEMLFESDTDTTASKDIFSNGNWQDLIRQKFEPIQNLLCYSSYGLELNDVIYVHGGLDLTKEHPYNDTTNDEKLWLRNEYYFKPLSHEPQYNSTGKIIISGHTPVQTLHPYNTPFILNNGPERYIIDGGSNSSSKTGVINVVGYANKKVTLLEQIPSD